MAGKKLPKDVDLASNIDVAARFFSDAKPAETKPDEKETPATQKQEKEKSRWSTKKRGTKK